MKTNIFYLNDHVCSNKDTWSTAGLLTRLQGNTLPLNLTSPESEGKLVFVHHLNLTVILKVKQLLATFLFHVALFSFPPICV